MNHEDIRKECSERLVLLAGTWEPEDIPEEPFSSLVLDFLSALSEKIRQLSRKEAGEELKTLGFWLRHSHLLALKEQYYEQGRIGLGLSFHIAPANVPLMFFYSCAIGLLAGNSCQVRVSGRRTKDADFLCSLTGSLLEEDRFQKMAKRISILSYDSKEADLTESFSRRCDLRVIWGGDRTVDLIRNIPLKPSASELVFPDRNSMAVLNAEAVLALSGGDLDSLAVRFYNDAYAMDQNACSCPRLVFWQEDREDDGKLASWRFWDAVSKAAERYELSGIKSSQKYGNLWELAGAGLFDAGLPGGDRPDAGLPDTGLSITGLRRWKNRLYVLTADRIPGNNASSLPRFGTFLEYHMKDSSEWTGAVSEKTQTLTCFGVSPCSLRDQVLRAKKKGVDRIVPVGQALDMDLSWDGKNLINCMSRKIYCAAERSQK